MLPPRAPGRPAPPWPHRHPGPVLSVAPEQRSACEACAESHSVGPLRVRYRHFQAGPCQSRRQLSLVSAGSRRASPHRRCRTLATTHREPAFLPASLDHRTLHSPVCSLPQCLVGSEGLVQPAGKRGRYRALAERLLPLPSGPRPGVSALCGRRYEPSDGWPPAGLACR